MLFLTKSRFILPELVISSTSRRRANLCSASALRSTFTVSEVDRALLVSSGECTALVRPALAPVFRYNSLLPDHPLQRSDTAALGTSETLRGCVIERR
jgi:hypothetical protein